MHPHPDEEPVELQTALGRLVMAWAPLESVLDGLCALLFKGFNGDQVERELPRTFGNKVKFVRKCIAKTFPGHPLVAAVGKMLDEIGKLADERHWLIHGFNLTENPLLDETTTKFHKFIHRPSEYALSSKTYSVAEVYDLSSRCMHIALLLGEMAQSFLSLRRIREDGGMPDLGNPDPLARSCGCRSETPQNCRLKIPQLIGVPRA